ncbi:MAG: hypothetical protein R3F62_03205 [Planctomycetota bacterium]
MHLSPLSASLCVLVTLASTVAAQEPVVGEYALQGRYSTSRRTEATLRVERNADGSLKLTREGRYSGTTGQTQPEPFTWTAPRAIQAGAQVYALYELAASSGLVALGGPLDPGADTNVLLGVYSIASDGAIREAVYNQTRHGAEAFWTRLRARGQRVTSPTPDLAALQADLQALLDVPAMGTALEGLDDLLSPFELEVSSRSGSASQIAATLQAENSVTLIRVAEGPDAVRGMVDWIEEPLEWAIQDVDSEQLYAPVSAFADAVKARFAPASAFRSLTLLWGRRSAPGWDHDHYALLAELEPGRFLVIERVLGSEN